jgi:hypothetical protein
MDEQLRQLWATYLARECSLGPLIVWTKLPHQILEECQP